MVFAGLFLVLVCTSYVSSTQRFVVRQGPNGLNGHDSAYKQRRSSCMACPFIRNSPVMCIHPVGGQECDIRASKCYRYLHKIINFHGFRYYSIEMEGQEAWARMETVDIVCGQHGTSHSNTPHYGTTSLASTPSTMTTTTPPKASVTLPGYPFISAGNVDVHLLASQGREYDSGILIISKDNVRSAACAHGWTSANSHVVCRMIGFTHGVTVSHTSIQDYGIPVYMENIKCSGSESNLALCPHHTDGTPKQCTDNKIVFVSCKAVLTTTATPLRSTTTPPVVLQVRLVDGPSPAEGRVEVLYNGVWGTVCDDNWDDDDAKVVCRMLGYDPNNAVHLSKSRYGAGVGPIMLDETQCTGLETNLGQCSYAPIGRSDCDHFEDAGVICERVSTTIPTTTTTAPTSTTTSTSTSTTSSTSPTTTTTTPSTTTGQMHWINFGTG